MQPMFKSGAPDSSTVTHTTSGSDATTGVTAMCFSHLGALLTAVKWPFLCYLCLPHPTTQPDFILSGGTNVSRFFAPYPHHRDADIDPATGTTSLKMGPMDPDGKHTDQAIIRSEETAITLNGNPGQLQKMAETREAREF